ncbi:MAG: hypothetical protein PV358_07115, partial [Acidimicrobiales bacterium]|nr:hypothetical protein [Acidimicrobiales bacterium]
AEVLDVLLPEIDFLSIGTNDLTQFLFAADRAHPKLALRYDWLSPSILRFIRRVVKQADDAGVPVVWATSPHMRLAPAGDLEGDWTSVADNDPGRVDRLNDLIRDVVSGRENASVIDLGAWAQRLPRGEFAPNHRAEGRDLTESGAAGAVAWMVPELFEVLGIEPSTEAPAEAEAPATEAPASDAAADPPAA